MFEELKQSTLNQIKNDYRQKLIELKSEQGFISYDLFEIYNWNYNQLGNDLLKILNYFHSGKGELLNKILISTLNSLINYIKKQNNNITRQELIKELFKSLLKIITIIDSEKIIVEFIYNDMFINKTARESIEKFILSNDFDIKKAESIRKYFGQGDNMKLFIKIFEKKYFGQGDNMKLFIMIFEKIKLEDLLYNNDGQLNKKIMFLFNTEWTKEFKGRKAQSKIDKMLYEKQKEEELKKIKLKEIEQAKEKRARLIKSITLFLIVILLILIYFLFINPSVWVNINIFNLH